jgi:aldehyde:ferredoxin oxidoreductase
MLHGYSGKLLRVNLTAGTIKEEPLNEAWAKDYIGGRGLALRYLWDEVQPHTDPLGPDNVLIVAPGPFAGTNVPMGSRFVLMAKSPLTGLLGDTESGGHFGFALKTAGYDLLIIEGRAARPVYLAIGPNGVKIKDASALWGQSVYDSQKALKAAEPGARVIGIGQAGENGVAYANVIHDLVYACGRAGLGAVMGSKNLKAVTVKSGRSLPPADPETLRAESKSLDDDVMSNASMGTLAKWGTWNGLAGLIANGILPTKNFQTGVFAGSDKLTGDALLESVFVDRRTCHACPLRCRRVVETTGEFPSSREYAGPQYETVAALGSLLLNGDPAAICHANQLCDAYGLDTISVGVCIAFTMESYERGVITAQEVGLEPKWGDAHAIMKLIDMTAQRQGWGDLMAQGVRKMAQKVGQGSAAWALEVKGLEIAMHDPRGKKGVGLSYATMHRGADHMETMHDEGFNRDNALPDLGFTTPMVRTDTAGKPLLVMKGQDYWGSLVDSVAMCKFPQPPTRPLTAPRLAKIFNAVTGWGWSVDDLMKAGERITNLARLFNVREGASRKDDTLPPRLAEKLTEGATAGESFGPDVLSGMLDEYYTLRGWDMDGIPTPAKLADLGLRDMTYVIKEAKRG